MRKRQERSLVTQRKLLRAAIEAFAESGFKGTSTRDIARRAGVHHPLITYHFGNKEQLWIAATDSVFREFGETLAGVLDPAKTQTPSARMQALIRNFVLFAQREPAVHRIILQEAASPGERLDWLVDTHLKPMVDATARLVEKLQGLGAMPQGNPKLITSMIRATAGGLLALGAELERLSGMDIDADGTLDEITATIVRVFMPGAFSAQETTRAQRK